MTFSVVKHTQVSLLSHRSYSIIIIVKDGVLPVACLEHMTKKVPDEFGPSRFVEAWMYWPHG